MIPWSTSHVCGYFSCDSSVALRIGEGTYQLKAGRNSSSLFGWGLSFWDDPFWAMREAVERVKTAELKDAAVVGVLIEVPVMLLVVRIVNRSKDWYECA